MPSGGWETWAKVPRELAVAGGRYVIFDGAMATYLHQCGVPIRVCAEELNLSKPRLIEQIHRAYVEAGATVVQTNTFAANRLDLARHGLDAQTVAINEQAVLTARAAVADRASVYGTMGPAAGGTRYGALLTADERSRLSQVYEEQALALIEAGVDGIVLETFPDLEELLLALRVVRVMAPQLPIVANLSPEEVGVTRDGVLLTKAFATLREAGASVVGLNCRLGPYGILRSFEQIVFDDGPYAAVPNGGILHRSESEGLAYTGDVDDFARVMSDIARLGVRWLGGCCGTTPEHIHKLVLALQAQNSRETWAEPPQKPSSIHVVADNRRDEMEGVGAETPLGPSIVDTLKERTAVIVELDPPKHLSAARFLAGATALSEAGADMITMADNSLGSVRISNMALASVLKQRGIEPLVHVTCRDRNLIGQQSHLMGLHVLGVRNILLITGDPSRYGDLPGATSVYDVSSMDLTKMVRKLNDGVGFSGKPLQRPAQFVIGTAFNPHVHNFAKAVDRLRRKVEAGADFVMTQPVYDPALMEQIAEATRDLGVPILIGIMPLTSARNAEFIHHQVPGISIPAEILSRMRETAPEEAQEVGVEIAKSLVDRALTCYRGIYLVTPFLKFEITVRLTAYIRERTATAVASAARRE
ncbi:bifunctional homocysteine S-methyltransferase/methylenetetrahydrofolate reductase [Alicyclobacillus hesperidum subsp. aegles]|uniref:bifunctional homocysteine S-methyltransferase/methylenetetrahydrofolate reductase n=1 Tax=Alicyclobacillus hesperidum TaxID=89784 RepID=UPI00222AB449|nr:bifunctional homocysteine S-methyltransferase/methylenetetrahydrofolate reductase [Alicyclobacillus hesperidum]GLG00686.1 bifunctional homocysteine S-methyltransferase/methylenetetrahydrofolate reductase [Alicyclobacillus hesperidum subsp. aegles]